MIYLCACHFKSKKDDKWQPGVAVLTAPGIADVLTIIKADGKPFTGRRIYDYRLNSANGAIGIPTD